MSEELWYTSDKYSFEEIAERLQKEELAHIELRSYYNFRKSDLSFLKQFIPEETIKQLVKDNHRIKAIKLFKILHDVSLKEAKDAVDKMILSER